MRRRLFTILWVASLVLLVATCAMWVRTHWRWDSIRYNDANLRSLDLDARTGGYIVEMRAWDKGPVGHPNWSYAAYLPGTYRFPDRGAYLSPRETPTEDWSLIGVSAGRTMVMIINTTSGAAARTNTGTWMKIDFRLAAIVFAILPVIGLMRSIHRWRKSLTGGLCQKCGYDLRATPDRCPECGAVPVKPQAVASTL